MTAKKHYYKVAFPWHMMMKDKENDVDLIESFRTKGEAFARLKVWNKLYDAKSSLNACSSDNLARINDRYNLIEKNCEGKVNQFPFFELFLVKIKIWGNYSNLFLQEFTYEYGRFPSYGGDMPKIYPNDPQIIEGFHGGLEPWRSRKGAVAKVMFNSGGRRFYLSCFIKEEEGEMNRPMLAREKQWEMEDMRIKIAWEQRYRRPFGTPEPTPPTPEQVEKLKSALKEIGLIDDEVEEKKK